MPRPILAEDQIHPAVREKITNLNADILTEVHDAVAQHAVVIVGMGQNPYPKKARKLLDEQKIAYQYMEYGNYFSQWRRRSALKMWTGWPTLPMVFVRGTLVGGAQDLERLHATGELARLLQA